MSDNDFVARLRIRWEAMGDMANDERAAAATEIESLRSGQREMMRTIATLKVERDEARRSCCEFAAMVDSADTVVMYVDSNRFHEIAMRYMKSRGWDCFKEDGK